VIAHLAGASVSYGHISSLAMLEVHQRIIPKKLLFAKVRAMQSPATLCNRLEPCGLEFAQHISALWGRGNAVGSF